MEPQIIERVGPDWEWILATADYRRNEQAELIRFMHEVRDRYNGEVTYPWSENILSESESVPLTPHLVGEGIDQMGLRAAEVAPAIFCPATYPAKSKGAGSREWAEIRQRGHAAIMHESKWMLLARRAMRHLAGYATCSLLVEPDFKAQMPRFRVRNPLNTFPDPQAAEDYDDLENCLYIYGHSPSWIRARYPATRWELGGPIKANESDGALWDILEWQDGECLVRGLLGKRGVSNASFERQYRRDAHMELLRIPNRAGRFTGVVPARITLDKVASALQHVVGSVDWAARLQFLNIIATEKAVFPDIYVIGDNNQAPKLLSADRMWKDGRTGEVNELQNVSQIGQLRTAPDQSSYIAIDKMENNARRGLGLVEPMAGQTHGALRTGRGIDALMDVATSPRVAEMHQTFEAWIPVLLKANAAVLKGYWGSKQFSLYSSYSADKGEVNFVPNQHFNDNDHVAVSYPIAGASIQDTNIALTQLFGAKAIPMSEFRSLHPWLRGNARELANRMLEEQLNDVALGTVQQAAVAGQLPLGDLVELLREVKKEGGADFLEAFDALAKRMEREAAREAEAQSAAATDQAALAGAQGQLPPSEAMPSTPGPTQGQAGIRELMNALSAGARGVG